jgi:hypothetical protein
MAHGKSLEMREIQRPEGQVIEGTECTVIFREIPGMDEPVPVGVKRCAPYTEGSRDRSLPGKARIRARRAARRAS